MKTKYFQMMYAWNSDNEDTVFCGKEEIYNIDRYAVMNGTRIEKIDERTCFYTSRGSVFEDYLDNILGWPLISKKLKKIFLDLNISGVKFFPIAIKNEETKTKICDYWLLNIYNFPDALDLSKSRYREFLEEHNMVMGLTHPVLIGNQVENMNILRVRKEKMIIYVSGKLKKAIEKNKITGIAFREVKVV